MNKEIYNILESIEKLGYEAYIVGGYVRDFLITKKESNDVDICTNASIDELSKIFDNYKIFNEYGCIKFTCNNFNISITTYRIEESYYNNKPDKILYETNLENDLLRRDFTINTICMDKYNNIIDLKGGISDLENHIIRVVGNTNNKFNEDATRVLRALRFMSILNFKLDENIINYIKENIYVFDKININKKKEELDKIFSNKNFNIFLDFIKEYDLEKEFGIYKKHDIKESNNYLEVWANLDVVFNYPFTRKEKKELENIKISFNKSNLKI